MRWTPCILILLVISFATSAFAQNADRREQNFMRSDKNKDGKISREEFTGRPENFDRRDTNKDGFISREEAGLPPAPTQQPDLTEGDNENTAPQRALGISIPLSISPIHELNPATQDGKTAEASYRIPPGKGPFPAIIFQHGGFGYMDQQRRHTQLTQGAVQTRFLAQGYVSVQTTRREYAHDPQSQAPIFEYLAVVEAVKKLDQVDPQSIVVMGGSGGASMTLDLISHTTVSAAIAGEPASVIFAGMLTKPAQDRQVRYEAINDPKAFWTPEVVVKVQDKVSRFQTPLLILHGDVHPLKVINMDYVIPEIQKSGKTLEVKVYPGKNHGFYWGTRVDGTFIDAMVQDIQAFSIPYLKTKPIAMNQELHSSK